MVKFLNCKIGAGKLEMGNYDWGTAAGKLRLGGWDRKTGTGKLTLA